VLCCVLVLVLCRVCSHHTFYNELSVAPEEHPTLLTESAFVSPASRERVCGRLFEEFTVPGFMSACSAALDLYCTGQGTGIVVQCGANVTAAVPVYEGYALRRCAVRSAGIGADSATALMARLMSARDPSALAQTLLGSGPAYSAGDGPISITAPIAQDARRVHGTVSLTPLRPSASALASDAKSSDAPAIHYELPDGQQLTLPGAVRTTPCELPFDPLIGGLTCAPVHVLAVDALRSVTVDFRSEMRTRILLSGGFTMQKQFTERFAIEYDRALTSACASVGLAADPARPTAKCVVALPERAYSSWIGGSILSSLNSALRMWITKQAFDEHGPAIIHRHLL
jgi:actin-related protein